MIRTHIETPVQAYIYRLIQLYINTHFSFQDTFCFCIPCLLYTDTYIQADTYTLHTLIRQYKHIFICWYSQSLIHIFSSQDTVSFCILCRLQWDWFLYTYTYIQADTYTLNIIHKGTLVQAYIYMLIQLYCTLIYIFSSQDTFCSYLHHFLG